MKAHPECKDCLKNMINQVALTFPKKKDKIKVKEIGLALLDKEFSLNLSSPVIANRIYHKIRTIFNINDPFRSFKDREISMAKAIIPYISEQNLSFRKAIELAVIGNNIDFFKDIDSVKNQISNDQKKGIKFYKDDIDILKEMIKKRKGTILYLADNTGEAFFDIFFYKKLSTYGHNVIYVVKGGPALNDITLDDLERGEINKHFENIISTGLDEVGIDINRSSEEFRQALKESFLIISKGMANFETLTEDKLSIPTFYLLKIKCTPVSKNLSLPKDEYIALLKEN
ncbi:MAG: DUF89 family protein [Deltaproteobacteria bacterium]|nr:DUF89 family protein [Deltaproteobacteria bacterium]